MFYVPSHKVTKHFTNRLMSHFGGYTSYPVDGAWTKDPLTRKERIFDKNIRFEVVTQLVDEIRQFIKDYNQFNWKESCIYFEVIQSQTEFI